MVKNFFKNSGNLLTAQQTSILSAAFIIMILTLVSKILGLLKDRVLTTYFPSPGLELDIYFAAARFPEAILMIFVGGAITVSFVPIFTDYLKKKKSEAWAMAFSSMGFVTLFFGLFVLILLVLAPIFPRFLAPGLVDQPQTAELMVGLLRVMFFSQILFVASGFFTGILHSLRRFVLPALAPILYNLGVIFGVVFLSSKIGIYSAAWGMLMGAVLHLSVQAPLVIRLFLKTKDASFKFGSRPSQTWFWHPGILRIGRIVLPRSLGILFAQINDVISLALASLISLGAITGLTLGTHLALAPVSLFGAAIGQAALPALALEVSTGNKAGLQRTLNVSLKQIIFLVAGVSVVLAVLKVPLVRLVFGASLFDWPSTVDTARVVLGFSLGLFARASVELLNRGFYAFEDSVTPLKVNVFSSLVNIVLSLVLVLVLRWPVWALAISFSLAAIINFLILFWLLDKKVGFEKLDLGIFGFKVGAAAVITGLSLYIPLKLLDQLVFDTTRAVDLAMLTGVVGGIGLSVYVFLTWLFKIEEAYMILNVFSKVKSSWRKFKKSPEAAVPSISGEGHSLS